MMISLINVFVCVCERECIFFFFFNFDLVVVRRKKLCTLFDVKI